MGIKFDSGTSTWMAFFSKRHPSREIPPITLRRKGIKTQAEARRIERQLIGEVEMRLHRKTIPVWKQLVDQWKEDALNRGLSGKTIENYFLNLRAYTFEKWADRTIDSISTQEIRDVIVLDLQDKSKHQQQAVLKFVRCVFQFAVDANLIQRNPAPKMKIKLGEKLKEVLTEEQVKIFLARAKEMNVEWYPHWTLAVMTGLRSGELYALTWEKVNLEERLIKVDCAWNSKDGFKSTKSGDDRTVEIAPPLLTLLKEWKIQSPGERGFVLPRLPKWDKGDAARELRLFLMGLNLPTIRFHSLRATWATLLLSKGVEPIKVMRMGGWKDMKTMMHYVRLAGVDIKGATDCLAEIHNPSREGAKVLSLKM